MFADSMCPLSKFSAISLLLYRSFLNLFSNLGPLLELEPALARRITQGLHAPVVLETTPVKHHLRDPGGLRLLGDRIANDGRRRAVPGLLDRDALVVARRGRQRPPVQVV